MKPDPDIMVDLFGRQVAFDLLLRNLYAQIAATQPDPRGFIADTIDGVIGSMDANENRPVNGPGRLIWQQAEAMLQDFADQVQKRFDENGKLITAGSS